MAFGFRLVDPYKNYTYETCSADTAAMYLNDPVKSTGAEDSKGRPVVTAAAAGDSLRGVCVGLLNYTVSDILGTGALFKNYKASGVTDMAVLVCSDPDAEYEAMFNGTPAAGAVGANTDMATYAAGSTISGISGCSLDTSVGSGTAQFRILRYSSDPSNIVAGASSRVVVRINESELKSVTGV